MTNQEIMAVIAEVYNRLYCTSFHGEQAMVVVDCERMLLQTMQKLNVDGPNQNTKNEDRPAG